ncbi:MAG: hypothetical protein QXM96_00275 [Candidatus Woesearchaeota archaeon]
MEFCEKIKIINEKYPERVDDLILEKLSDIIVYNKADVVNILENNGVKLDDDTLFSNKLLADKISENINKNDELKASLIYYLNSKIENGKIKSDDEAIKITYAHINNLFPKNDYYDLSGSEVTAIAKGVEELSKLGKTALEQKQKKQELIIERQRAKNELISKVLDKENRKFESGINKKMQTERLIIGGSIILFCLFLFLMFKKK